MKRACQRMLLEFAMEIPVFFTLYAFQRVTTWSYKVPAPELDSLERFFGELMAACYIWGWTLFYRSLYGQFIAALIAKYVFIMLGYGSVWVHMLVNVLSLLGCVWIVVTWILGAETFRQFAHLYLLVLVSVAISPFLAAAMRNRTHPSSSADAR